MRKARLDFIVHALRGIGTQSTEARRETKLAPMRSDEIEHRETFFVFVEAQSPAKLLKKDREALCRPQEENRVDLRNIDSLVIQVHDEDE
jgi:hypothetical protein